MGSPNNSLKQLRALGAQIDQLRTETRGFLEKKDREFGLLQKSIETICSGIVVDSAAATFDNGSGTKRAREGKDKSLPAKKIKEEAMKIGKIKGEYFDDVDEEGDYNPLVIKESGKIKANGEGFVEVYTDGACSNNGQGGAKAGVGVWWGEKHHLNYSHRVWGCRETNNVGEIQAATVALHQAVNAKVDKLIIYTDSQFVINCVTKWMAGWKRNGWMTASKQPVKNREDLEDLDKVLQENKGLKVRWEYVKGHAGIKGNDEADRLAVAGAKKNSPAPSISELHGKGP